MSSTNVESWLGKESVQIKNGAILRGLNIDPDWTTLNIGLWYSFTTGSQINIAGTPRLYFGLCSGNTNVIGDPTTDYFIGMRWTDITVTYTSSSLYTHEVYTVDQGKVLTRSPIGDNELTDFIGTWTSFCLSTPTGVPAKSSYAFMQITRGSPNYGVTILYPSATANVSYGQCTEALFLSNLQNDTPISDLPYGYTKSGNYLIPADETASGSLDHIIVAWDREEPEPDLVVHGMGVCVFG